MTRSLFIESLVGNIKEKYFFEKKLGSGGYGAVYLAKNKVTGKNLHSIYRKIRFEILVKIVIIIRVVQLLWYLILILLLCLGEKVAIKAMQKSRISDYEAFQNEISILRSLVSNC